MKKKKIRLINYKEDLSPTRLPHLVLKRFPCNCVILGTDCSTNGANWERFVDYYQEIGLKLHLSENIVFLNVSILFPGNSPRGKFIPFWHLNFPK